MDKMNKDYKIKTAIELTELAIQNSLIPIGKNVTATATDVTNFFKTIYESLDDNFKQ